MAEQKRVFGKKCDQLEKIEGGNIEPPQSLELVSWKYVFTYNNYTDKTIDFLKTWECSFIMWSKEVGEKEGTPHLQGYFELKGKGRNGKRIADEWELALGKRNFIAPAGGDFKDQVVYVTKLGTQLIDYKRGEPRGKHGGARAGAGRKKKASNEFMTQMKAMCLQKYQKFVWKPFQLDILEICKKEAEDRTIYWYWSKEGDIGKSTMCKYISLTMPGVIVADGKASDVFNQVMTMIDNETIPEIVLMDLPRTSCDRINYGMLEKLKNGMLYSGKYEGGVCLFPNPRMIVFANFEPDFGAMSADRWRVVQLDKNGVVPIAISMKRSEAEIVNPGDLI